MTARRLVLLLSLSLATLAGASIAAAIGLGWNADKLSSGLADAGKLPALPAGVEELRFSDLYTMPVGPQGLELTPRAAALAGKRVRILGFMVKQAKPAPGIALLTPYTLTTNEGEYGLCDDLPPTTLFVVVPQYADIAVPHTPGPLLLTGRLETTPREESDGRVSQLRLVLDDGAAAVTPAPEAGTSAAVSAAAVSPAGS